MDNDQFKAWLEDYLNAFPGTREWLSTLRNVQETLRFWRLTLTPVDKDQAAYVTMRMAAGDVPAVPAFEREQTAAIVRRHVSDRINRETPHSTSSEAPETFYAPRSEQAISCAAILGGILKDISEGMSKEDAKAKWLPDSDAPEKQPRYRCLDCRDSGLRKVWSVKSMSDAKMGKLKQRGHYTAVTRCTCRAGERTSFTHLTPFDLLKWCEFGNEPWEKEAENLVEFMEGYEGRRAERMENYSPELASF